MHIRARGKVMSPGQEGWNDAGKTDRAEARKESKNGRRYLSETGMPGDGWYAGQNGFTARWEDRICGGEGSGKAASSPAGKAA